MANTKLIKKRIKTAKNIAQITKAMEMVAASKMRKAQQQALSSRPYSEALRKILLSLLQSATKLDHPLMKSNESDKTAILLISAEKGLCGGLNTNHFRHLKHFSDQHSLENLQFLVIGKKGREFLTKSNYPIVANFPQIKEKVTFEESLPVSRFLINAYLKKEIGKAFLSFTNFLSTLSQKPKIIQILPVRLEDLSKELGLLEVMERETEQMFGRRKEYLLEPDQKTISGLLLPYFVELVVYHYILEAQAAEHSARMVAMKSASENANEIVSELNLTYNKARQDQITNQIAEIATATLAITQ